MTRNQQECHASPGSLFLGTFPANPARQVQRRSFCKRGHRATGKLGDLPKVTWQHAQWLRRLSPALADEHRSDTKRTRNFCLFVVICQISNVLKREVNCF